MDTLSGDFVVTTDELRAVAAYAVACAEPALVIFEKVHPDDPRPAAALEAARVFAEGAPRSRLQRTAAADAHRAARDAATEPARHAASAAGDAAAAKRATPVVLDVLGRYPRAPKGRNRIAVLMQRLDSLLRDPPPTPRVVDDPGPFFHGTRADVRPGDLLTPGWRSNYGSQRRSNHIYLTASRAGAPLAAELARGEGPGRVYRVEPLGTIEDDPNVTDKRFPGNPTRSYRTTEPLRVVEEITGWERPPQEMVQHMRERMAELAELGIEAMDD